jgi:hypothetical protein
MMKVREVTLIASELSEPGDRRELITYLVGVLERGDVAAIRNRLKRHYSARPPLGAQGAGGEKRDAVNRICSATRPDFSDGIAFRTGDAKSFVIVFDGSLKSLPDR